MPPLVDNDIFCKLGVSGLLVDALALFGATVATAARLPALPYMLRRGRLHTRYGPAACEKLVALADAMPLAPTPTATWLERLAPIPDIDAGEAQLFASAAKGSLIVFTGDKRALTAAAAIPGLAEAVANRIVTLEAALLALCERKGDDAVRAAVQPLLGLETTVKVCFSSATTSPREGLRSYFDNLRADVRPLALWDPRVESP